MIPHKNGNQIGKPDRQWNTHAYIHIVLDVAVQYSAVALAIFCLLLRLLAKAC